MAEEDSFLDELYPFLKQKGDASSTDVSVLLDSVRQKADHSLAVKRAFFDSQAQRVVIAAAAVADVYRNGGRLFTMGNGGSSCDAAHVAVEFMHPITAGRPALSAINLVADTAMLTAVGNVYIPTRRFEADHF